MAALCLRHHHTSDSGKHAERHSVDLIRSPLFRSFYRRVCVGIICFARRRRVSSIRFSSVRRCTISLNGWETCTSSSVGLSVLRRQWKAGILVPGVFLFANCVNSFLTNVGKVSVGRLRPHFIPSCYHKYSYQDFCQFPNEWLTNYTCSGESSDVVKEKDGAYDIRYVVAGAILLSNALLVLANHFHRDTHPPHFVASSFWR